MPPKAAVTHIELGEKLDELKEMFKNQYPGENSAIPGDPFCKL
jgi:hypothetical protein